MSRRGRTGDGPPWRGQVPIVVAAVVLALLALLLPSAALKLTALTILGIGLLVAVLMRS